MLCGKGVANGAVKGNERKQKEAMIANEIEEEMAGLGDVIERGGSGSRFSCDPSVFGVGASASCCTARCRGDTGERASR